MTQFLSLLQHHNQYQLGTHELCYLTLTSSIIVIAASLAFKFYRFFQRRLRIFQVFKRGNVPQATHKPGLFGGNVFDTLTHGDNTKRLHALHLKLGKTFGVFYAGDPWAVSVDLNLLQKVFVTEGSTHVDVTMLRLPFVSEINESLAQLRGDKWRQVRRIMGPSFTVHHMKSDNVFEDISKVCDAFIEFIHSHKELNTNKGRIIIDVHYAFKRFSLEVIFRVAFGCEHKQKLVANEKDKLVDLIDEGSHMLTGPFVLLSIMFESAQRLFGFFVPLSPIGAIIRYVHSIISDSIDKRRAVLQQIRQKTHYHERKTIDSLIERFDLGKMSDDTLKANLFFILLAGYETTANTLAMLFYYLASNQRVQDKLRQSILSGEASSQYLDWVIQETLRLFPAVPLPIGRVLEHDIEHEGQKFFKGTTIVASISSIHRWPEYWLTGVNKNDLDEFRPERFGEPVPDGIPSTRYFAFGIGPRYCIGQNLALIEIKAIVERILSKYKVTLCELSPNKIDAVSQNLIHFIITHSIELEFNEISTL